jgi:prophage antirepressor-like protein
MEIIKQFEKDDIKLDIYGTFEQPLFLADQIGEILEITNIRSSIPNINPKWKKLETTQDNNKKRIFILEPALYQLVMKSRKKEAIDFQNWVFEDVLPSIRKTGKYEFVHRFSKNVTFNMQTEFDLHSKVVHFMKKRFPGSLFTVSLGENQDTSEKRIKSHKMGYIKGNVDLVIHNQSTGHNGYAIEFKSPKGIGELSPEQQEIITQYSLNGFKTLISNDYDEIIESLINYFSNVRYPCNGCNRKFKSTDSLKTHKKYFHR